MAASTDRLGVCNRLNLLLVDRPAWDRLLPIARTALEERGIALSEPPHSHPLGHEWALDSGAEAHVTVAPVDGPADAALTASRNGSFRVTVSSASGSSRRTAWLDLDLRRELDALREQVPPGQLRATLPHDPSRGPAMALYLAVGADGEWVRCQSPLPESTAPATAIGR